VALARGACILAPGSALAKSTPVFRGARDPAILKTPKRSAASAIVSTPETSDTHFFHSFSIVLGILFAFTILLFGFARVLGKNQNADQLEDPLVKHAAEHRTATQ
jgi:hypothetical protein